ncbi:MAG: discoidin domain-containing protein, partial [Pirellulaceae bacterium]|nr:discoidin domain-containing protein [Pirellulaceae bacterium]
SVGDRRAVSAIDGDPKTHWHTSFTPNVLEHPHELVIDLGKRYKVRGFRYLARQDGGWNGAVKECEFYVSKTPDGLTAPAVKTTFKKSKRPQEVTFEPVEGRFVRIKALSEVNGGPWTSIAELGVVGE